MLDYAGLLKLPGGDVDAQRQKRQKRQSGLNGFPGLDLATGLTQDPSSQGHDQTSVLGQ
jgi:hypothetical protein